MGGKNYMNRKLTTISVVAILILISTTTITNATTMKHRSNNDLSSETISQQVYLGYANITGNGSNSILEAVAENDIPIRIDAQSGYVDFYINYDMNCSGTTDEGVITLTIFLNGQNISFNLVQTPTSKNGMLKIENVEVHRQDALMFVINAAYGSIIPPYSNSTYDTGVGVISKMITYMEKSTNPFLEFLEQHPHAFLVLRRILNL